jgi:hypothetical protein
MIAGARELMTPGVWKKQGFTYALIEGGESQERTTTNQPLETLKGQDVSEHDRASWESLDRLRAAL